MAIKFYSEMLDKNFDSLAAAQAAEEVETKARADKEKAQETAKEQIKSAYKAIKAAEAEVAKQRKLLSECKELYKKMIDEYTSEYGSVKVVEFDDGSIEVEAAPEYLRPSNYNSDLWDKLFESVFL